MSAVNSCCSDLREINEAKVQNILSYLDDVHFTGNYGQSVAHSQNTFPLQDISAQQMRWDNRQMGVPQSLVKAYDPTAYLSEESQFNAMVGLGRHSPPLSAENLSELQNAEANGEKENKMRPVLSSRHSNADHLSTRLRSGSQGRSPQPHTNAGGARSTSSYATTSALLMPISSENAQVYNGIKRKIDELKRANDLLTGDNKDLKQQLDTFKDKENARIAKVQEIARTEIEGMRAEQQRLQTAQLQTVAKLVKEKEALVLRCDELTTSTRMLQESKISETRRLADEHSAAINEMKGKWLVQEKQRREQWMLAESKRIKDNTLKAMEPDIALLMNRHKAEKARIQEECDLAIKKKDEQMAEKEKSLQEARLKMGRDLEGLVLKEREAFRSKIEEESSRYQKAMEEQRRQSEDKLASTNKFFEEQKQHYLSTIKDLESQLLEAKGKAVEKDATFHAAVGAETQKLMQIKERELAQRQHNLEEELEVYRQSLERENVEVLRRKEEEYKMLMRQERDAAITKVIASLEEEHMRQLANTKETSSLTKERMTRQEREIERLTLEKQVLEQQTTSLVNQSKTTNDLVAKLQEELQQLRDSNASINESNEHQFEQRMSALDKMWQQKLNRFEAQHVEEVHDLRHKSVIAEKNHQRQIEELETNLKNIESKHNSELSSINDRVVAAMAKRDAMVQMLTEQLRLAQICIQERESELERHRMLLES